MVYFKADINMASLIFLKIYGVWKIAQVKVGSTFRS